MQPLQNAFELTYHPARMRPRLYAMSGGRVRAYARCRENANALRAPFFLDPSGPTEDITFFLKKVIFRAIRIVIYF